MNHRYQISNALLWAAEIIASAILYAPAALAGWILPTLAVGSLFLIRPESRRSVCRSGSR
jgi:hypothetical protein